MHSKTILLLCFFMRQLHWQETTRHNEAGTEVVKQKCAWHTTEVVSKKDYIHLWMGGNGSVSVEARKENKKQHSIFSSGTCSPSRSCRATTS